MDGRRDRAITTQETQMRKTIKSGVGGEFLLGFCTRNGWRGGSFLKCDARACSSGKAINLGPGMAISKRFRAGRRALGRCDPRNRVSRAGRASSGIDGIALSFAISVFLARLLRTNWDVYPTTVDRRWSGQVADTRRPLGHTYTHHRSAA